MRRHGFEQLEVSLLPRTAGPAGPVFPTARLARLPGGRAGCALVTEFAVRERRQGSAPQPRSDATDGRSYAVHGEVAPRRERRPGCPRWRKTTAPPAPPPWPSLPRTSSSAASDGLGSRRAVRAELGWPAASWPDPPGECVSLPGAAGSPRRFGERLLMQLAGPAEQHAGAHGGQHHPHDVPCVRFQGAGAPAQPAIALVESPAQMTKPAAFTSASFMLGSAPLQPCCSASNIAASSRVCARSAKGSIFDGKASSARQATSNRDVQCSEQIFTPLQVPQAVLVPHMSTSLRPPEIHQRHRAQVAVERHPLVGLPRYRRGKAPPLPSITGEVATRTRQR